MRMISIRPSEVGVGAIDTGLPQENAPRRDRSQPSASRSRAGHRDRAHRHAAASARGGPGPRHNRRPSGLRRSRRRYRRGSRAAGAAAPCRYKPPVAGYAPAALQEELPLLSQGHVARVAMEQAHIQPLLQPGHGLTGRRRRQVELAPGGDEAAGLSRLHGKALIAASWSMDTPTVTDSEVDRSAP